MKKLSILLLCFVFALSFLVLSGCSATDDPDTSDANRSENQTDSSDSPDLSGGQDESRDMDNSDDTNESEGEYDPYDEYFPNGTDISIGTSDAKGKTPEQLIKAGLVKRVGALKESPEKGALPLIKWVFENVDMSDIGYEDSVPKSIVATGLYHIDEIKSFYLYHASYSAKNAESSEDLPYSILFASSLDNPREYVLLFHGIYVDLNSDEVWKEIKEHKSFGSLLKDKPKGIQEVLTKTVSLMDIVGKDRIILTTVYYKGNQVLIISTKDKKNPRADIVDLSSLKIQKSYDLKEPGKKGFDIEYIMLVMSEPNLWIFSLVPAPDDYENAQIYALRLVNGNMEESLTDQDMYDYLEGLPEEYQLKSDSGRYTAFSQNSDLYIKDLLENKTTLIFDSKPDDRSYDFPDDINDIYIASMLFFIGDELYYNVYGWEWCWGINSYNPVTNETTEYYRFLNSADFYIGDYLYAFNSTYEYSVLYRFLRDKSKEPERVFSGWDYNIWVFAGQKNKEHFAIVSEHNPVNNQMLYLNSPVIRVFDHNTLKTIFEIGFENPYFYYSDVMLCEDYVFVPVFGDGDVTYKKAYVVKYK